MHSIVVWKIKCSALCVRVSENVCVCKRKLWASGCFSKLDSFCIDRSLKEQRTEAKKGYERPHFTLQDHKKKIHSGSDDCLPSALVEFFRMRSLSLSLFNSGKDFLTLWLDMNRLRYILFDAFFPPPELHPPLRLSIIIYVSCEHNSKMWDRDCVFIA